MLAKSAFLCALIALLAAFVGSEGNAAFDVVLTLRLEPDADWTRATNGFGVLLPDATAEDAALHLAPGAAERVAALCATACASEPGIDGEPCEDDALPSEGKCSRSATGLPAPCPDEADAARSTLAHTWELEAAEDFLMLRSELPRLPAPA